MNFWFLIWVFLAMFIGGIFLWSMQVLFKQKRAWAEFAKRQQLSIRSPAMMKSPVISGNYKGFPFTIYSEAQQSEDQRGRRYRSIIQFELPAMPVAGVVASERNHNFANGLLDLTSVYVPDFPTWDKTILIRTSDSDLLKAYLTDERLRALQAMMTLKSYNAMYVFDTTAGFLRFETADPLYDLDKLERICAKIADQANLLKNKA